MGRESWVEALKTITEDATSLTNTTTEGLLFPNAFISASHLRDGRALRVTAFGKVSTTGTPTLTFAVRLGGLSGTLIAQTEALTMGSGVANANWRLQFEIQTRVNGSSGAVICMGLAHVHTAAGTVLTNVFGSSGWDAPTQVTVDLSIPLDLAITGTWSAASASNVVTGLIEVVETLY